MYITAYPYAAIITTITKITITSGPGPLARGRVGKGWWTVMNLYFYLRTVLLGTVLYEAACAH